MLLRRINPLCYFGERKIIVQVNWLVLNRWEQSGTHPRTTEVFTVLACENFSQVPWSVLLGLSLQQQYREAFVLF